MSEPTPKDLAEVRAMILTCEHLDRGACLVCVAGLIARQRADDARIARALGSEPIARAIEQRE
jgi:hypothetical protein